MTASRSAGPIPAGFFRLLPEIDREGYAPLELQAGEAEDLRIVAEWLGPVE